MNLVMSFECILGVTQFKLSILTVCRCFLCLKFFILTCVCFVLVVCVVFCWLYLRASFPVSVVVLSLKFVITCVGLVHEIHCFLLHMVFKCTLPCFCVCVELARVCFRHVVSLCIILFPVSIYSVFCECGSVAHIVLYIFLFTVSTCTVFDVSVVVLSLKFVIKLTCVCSVF